jgi:hypothetical protein
MLLLFLEFEVRVVEITGMTKHKLEICVCLLKLKVLLLLEVFDDLLRLVVDIVLCCNEDELLFGFDKVEYSFNFVFLNVVKRLPGL